MYFKIKKYLIPSKSFIIVKLKVLALGNRIFVSSFQMAGIEGLDVQSPKEALSKINQIISKNEAGLVLLSDDIGKDIRIELAKIRSIKPIPLIFELPSPGSKKEKVDYRALLKQILGV
jgi:V/A-type H+/Na+-transporting ATPase subunit F